MSATETLIGAVERGLVPDALVRHGIRRLCAQRLDEESRGGPEAEAARLAALAAAMRQAPVALATQAANAQHYALPPAFFELVLGRRLKYSCALFPTGAEGLAEAEELALEETAAHAGLEDSQRVLDLGCGWGSLSTWIAEHHPASRVTSVSNSAVQGAFLRERLARRGLTNVEVVTADVNVFTPEGRYDRVVSVEMFEHVRNWPLLLSRIASWLTPEGALFLHVFRHRRLAYPFEADGADDWMARHFFTGGLMPSDDLLLRFGDHLEVTQRWRWSGLHYNRTALAWLSNLDARRRGALTILAEAHGEREAARALRRWRVFFLACAELFGYGGGEEWGVSHYLLRRRHPASR